MRVVSLVPAATEIAYGLGVEPVGVSQACDYPPAARELPAVTASRIDTDATSGAIDDQVRTATEEEGVYDVDRELFAKLEPDVVITQGMCEVCAVGPALVDEAIAELDVQPEIVTTDPHSLADVFEDVRTIGRALDRETAAIDLVADLRARVAAVEETAAGAEETPEAVVLDWLDPVMVAGHWIPELVELAGGTYPLAEPGAHSTPREWETIHRADPDVLIAAPCGFELNRTRATLTDLTTRQDWETLQAVESGRAYAMDGNQHVNRPGPQLVDTLEGIAWSLHPTLFETPPRDVLRPLDELDGTRHQP
jgi:iron complex transport system substrate-binding protein